MNRFIAAAAVVLLSAAAGAQAPPAKQLGTINFPISASPAAQAPFLTGVKALFNFEFDIAARCVPRGAEGGPGVRARLLGRGDELQPSALGAAGSRQGPARDGPAGTNGGRPLRARRRPARSACSSKSLEMLFGDRATS